MTQTEDIHGKLVSIDKLSFDNQKDCDEDGVVKGVTGSNALKVGFIIETAEEAQVYCETFQAEYFEGNDLQVGCDVFLHGHFETDAETGDPTFIAARGAVRT